jgi:hypothetical protein
MAGTTAVKLSSIAMDGEVEGTTRSWNVLSAFRPSSQVIEAGPFLSTQRSTQVEIMGSVPFVGRVGVIMAESSGK